MRNTFSTESIGNRYTRMGAMKSAREMLLNEEQVRVLLEGLIDPKILRKRKMEARNNQLLKHFPPHRLALALDTRAGTRQPCPCPPALRPR